MCLKDLRDEFLYDCECRHLAKGSLRNYRAATRFLVDFLELRRITELEEVKPHHIRDLMKEKQDMGSTPRYINDLLKVWRTWFNYLVTEGYLDERDNPAKKVKPLRQPKTIIDTFTVDEMRRMIRFYDGTDFLSVRNKTIIMLLFDTGMRCNEMILMEPEDIKPDYILVKHGKGSKERVVPKSPALSKQLMKYRTLRDAYLKEYPSRHKNLFLSKHGKPLQPRFFCQFLCPMGAVFALLPVLPFARLHRQSDGCIPGCNACKQQCPVCLKLEETSLRSGECIACEACVGTCPKQNIHRWDMALCKSLWLPVLVKALLFFLLGCWLGFCRFI